MGLGTARRVATSPAGGTKTAVTVSALGLARMGVRARKIHGGTEPGGPVPPCGDRITMRQK
jgi:hypothetical protein